MKKNKLIKLKFFLLFLLFLFLKIFFNILNEQKYNRDEITLITALFKIKSKYNFANYENWVKNLLQINTSILFFVDREIFPKIKSMRPKILQNKTVWIKTDIQEFYTYKKFKIDFQRAHDIDKEKRIHTVLLYLVWAEKCFFIKKAIKLNFFKSKCFYWIDAGFFRKKNVIQNLNGWPSNKKCIEDPRVLVNSIRTKEVTNKELKILKNLDTNNSIFKSFMNKKNVGGGFFGGKSDYLLKFIKLYVKTIKLFIKHSIFIGKDQNLFAYIAYLRKDIVKTIYSGDWYYLFDYLK